MTICLIFKFEYVKQVHTCVKKLRASGAEVFADTHVGAWGYYDCNACALGTSAVRRGHL